MNKFLLALGFLALTSTVTYASTSIICSGSTGSDLYNVNLEIQNPSENSIIEVLKNNSLQLRIQGEGPCGVMLVETQLIQDSPQSRPYRQTRIDALQKYNCNDTDALKMNIVGVVLNQRKASLDGKIGIQLRGERQPTLVNLICK